MPHMIMYVFKSKGNQLRLKCTTPTPIILNASASDLRYIHLLNHEKMFIKSEVEDILFNLATNDHSDEAFLLTSKFWP